MLSEIDTRRAELETICRRHGVHHLELFGSATTDAFREAESDFDFLVEFESRETSGYADRYFGLLEALEALFGRPIDLVVESAISNPYFRESIDRTRTLLYAA